MMIWVKFITEVVGGVGELTSSKEVWWQVNLLGKILIPTHFPRQTGLTGIDCQSFKDSGGLFQHPLFQSEGRVEFSSIIQLEFDWTQIPVLSLKGPVHEKH